MTATKLTHGTYPELLSYFESLVEAGYIDWIQTPEGIDLDFNTQYMNLRHRENTGPALMRVFYKTQHEDYGSEWVRIESIDVSHLITTRLSFDKLRLTLSAPRQTYRTN